MKTVHKMDLRPLMLIALSVFFGGMATQIPAAYGQTALPPATAPSPVADSTTATAAPASSTAAPVVDAAPKIVAPSTNPDPTIAAAATPAAEKESKGPKTISGAEDKIADSAKGVAKRLSATEAMTLDDLNSAHQAIAKIEALIDLEKHLNELDKIRNEREGGGPSLSGAIPASALRQANQMPMQALPMPLPSPISSSFSQRAMPMPTPMSSFSNLEVQRIVGSSGRFSAIIKTGDAQTKTVQVGDQLEGATVTAITSSGVELHQNNVKHVLHVKNVQAVFNNTP